MLVCTTAQAARSKVGKCGSRSLCASGQGGSRTEPQPVLTVQLYIRHLDWRLHLNIRIYIQIWIRIWVRVHIRIQIRGCSPTIIIVDCKWIATSATHAGASFPQVRIAKEPNGPTNRLERPSLQHELLALSGCCGLRIFASFLKLDQAYPPEKPRAPRTQNSLQTIGWSEVSSVKVINASSELPRMRSRNRRSGWRPFFTM